MYTLSISCQAIFPNEIADGKLTKINYANHFSVRYVYDDLDNIKEVWYNDNGTETKAFAYTYTAYGQMLRFDNLLTGKSICVGSYYLAAGTIITDNPVKRANERGFALQ